MPSSCALRLSEGGWEHCTIVIFLRQNSFDCAKSKLSALGACQSRTPASVLDGAVPRLGLGSAPSCVPAVGSSPR